MTDGALEEALLAVFIVLDEGRNASTIMCEIRRNHNTNGNFIGFEIRGRRSFQDRPRRFDA